MAEQLTQVLGIVAMSNKGEYNSQTDYEKLNIVTYNGGSYCAKQNCKGILPTDPDYWQLLAQKGAKGDTGSTGDEGPRGPKGEKGDTGSPGGSPLVVSSTSEMIDTTKIYVNLTDDRWYYHDGTDWQSGGLYQTSGIDEDAIGLFELDENVKNQINKERFIDYDRATSHYRIEDNKVVTNTSVDTYSSTVIDVSEGETYHLRSRERSNNTYGYIFADDEANVISYGMQGTGTTQYFDELVKVPSGATKLYNSWYSENDPNNTNYIRKCYIKDTNNKLEILDVTGCFKKMILPTVTNGLAYGIKDNELLEITVSSYASCVFDVTEGEVYNIMAYEQSRRTYGYIFTDDESNILDFGMQGQWPLSSAIYYKQTVKVPAGATKMYCTWNIGLDDASSKPFTVYKGAKIVEEFSGKTISVIGDSISTKIDKNAYEIVIEEEDVGIELSAYLTYYDVYNNNLSLGGHTFTQSEIGTEVTFTPTSDDVGKGIGLANNYNGLDVTTWWELLENNEQCKVNPVCWSGASITSHEANTNSLKTSYSWHDAQIRKVGIRTPGTMTRTSPDYIIIYRGTNDFSHSPYTKLSSDTFANYNYTYPQTDVINSNEYGYKEGLVLLVSKLRAAYPNSKIYICTLNVFKRVNYSHFPTNNGYNSLPQFNNAIREVCDFLGCGCIELDKDGITFENCYSEGYITDSATTPTHPNSKGHEMIYKQVLKDLK